MDIPIAETSPKLLFPFSLCSTISNTTSRTPHLYAIAGYIILTLCCLKITVFFRTSLQTDASGSIQNKGWAICGCAWLYRLRCTPGPVWISFHVGHLHAVYHSKNSSKKRARVRICSWKSRQWDYFFHKVPSTLIRRFGAIALKSRTLEVCCQSFACQSHC